MHMFNALSELCCKFQMPTSNTVGGDPDTRTVLQSVTYGRSYVRTRGKTIWRSQIRCGGIKLKKKLHGGGDVEAG